ncbi:MAG TPA: glycosyltransferase, partial [Micropepsaceae bacterium]|nr:glycosyltransferase [Micropepsaceae bacterium]
MLGESVAASADPPAWDESVSPRSGSRQATRPLKICFITETLHAGVGQHVVDASLELSRRGHQVHLIYSPTRCEQRFLASLTDRVHCVPLQMPHDIRLGDVSTFASIRKYVRAKGPFDIVHGHSSKGGGYARLLKLFGAGKTVYSPHAFVTLSPVPGPVKRQAYRTLEWALARLTDRIICTSRGELDHACSLDIARERLALIPNGGAPMVGPTRSAMRAKLGFSPDQVVVGFAGR